MNGPFSITYTVTVDDMIVWNQYHLAHLPSYKRSLLTSVLLLAVFVFAVVTSIWGHGSEGILMASFGTIGGVSAALWSRKRSWARYVRRRYSEGKNAGVIGRHTLAIEDNGFLESTEVNEGITRWAGIERIVEAPGYSFIYTGAFVAYVVPVQGIVEGDYNAFMAELKHRWELAQAPKSSPEDPASRGAQD